MLQLAERQRQFVRAILDPGRPVPPGCIDHQRKPSEKGFAVYRNNVMVSFIDALRESYPAVCRLLGDEYFRALAREYAVQNPPTSPVLLDYGATFPEFVEHFTPLAQFAYLADVARIERAWLEAYHAADEMPLNPALLARIPSDRVGSLCFTPHPSLRIVRSVHPALSIWRSNVEGDGSPPSERQWAGETALIVRPDAQVDVRSVMSEAAEFLDALSMGQSLASAAGAALCLHAQFDVPSHLAAMLEGGLFVRYHLAEDED